MMPADRDLLIVEPFLFRDCIFPAQRLVTGVGSTTADVLTVTNAGWQSRAVAAGMVVIVDGMPLEITEVLDNSQVTVSMLRADAKDSIIEPPSFTNKPVVCFTFVHQIRRVYVELLEDLQVNAPAQTGFDADESQITDTRHLNRVAALGAVASVMGACSAPAGAESALAVRAAHYRALFTDERDRLRLPLDLNADGLPDALRRYNQPRQNRS